MPNYLEKSLQKSCQKAESVRQSINKDEEERVSQKCLKNWQSSYTEKAVDSGTLLFKLFEHHSIYVIHLKDLGIVKTVNKTRWKNLILNHFPGAQEQCDGRNTILVFSKVM